MKLKQLFADDDAVSPVIGVILMVAITVILAAVIASFVLGLGQSSDEVQPNTSFSFDYDGSSNLEVVISDGDSLEAGNLFLRGSDGSNINIAWDGSTTTGGSINDGVGGIDPSATSYGSGTEFNAGQGLEFAGIGSTYQVDVVWETSEDTATLQSDEGPDA